MNTSSSDFVNLSRVRFEEGIDFVFDLDTILAPQERMIVPASQVALNANYLTTGFRIASGEFSQNLSNGGEAIGLVRPDNTELIRFSYSDELPWPLEADGFGFSLQLANPISNPDHSQPQSWIAGAPLGNRDYDNWASNYPSADLNDPQQDWDNDSVSNNAERLLGLDPTDAVSLNPYLTSLDSSGSFSYSRRDPALTGARYTVWTSNNLVDWEQDVGANQSPSATNALGVQAVEVLLSTPLDDEQLFVRIQAN